MRQIQLVLCLAAVLVLAFSGCGPKSPEEQVAATRAQYTVKLESFTAEEPPSMIEEGAMAEGAMAEETAAVAEEAAMAEEGAAEELAEPAEVSGPRPMDIILHLLVRFNGDEALPGITVEVTQADPFGKEKEPTLHWIETAGMGKSDVQQVDLKLEGLDFEDGDAFSVLLREVVPAEARGDYREFAEAAP